MNMRVRSEILVQALIRRVAAEGGFAAVLHRGDAGAGAIVIQTIEPPDRQTGLFERIPDFAGGYRLEPIAAQYCGDSGKIAQYLERRLRSDPDLWLVELDVANAQQLAAEMLISG